MPSTKYGTKCPELGNPEPSHASLSLATHQPSPPSLVRGWDCSDPLNLTISDASGRCTAATAAKSEETLVYIVQFNAVKQYSGFKCEVTIKTVQFIGGLFSYQKHLEISGGTIPFPIS